LIEGIGAIVAGHWYLVESEVELWLAFGCPQELVRDGVVEGVGAVLPDNGVVGRKDIF
jgi:hypothetical protein